jgi:hypothetical protein
MKKLMTQGWTLQLLIDCDIVVTARCKQLSCDNSQELNLQALKTKLGPAALVMHNDLAPKMRCSRCGKNNIGLSYSPREPRRDSSHLIHSQGAAALEAH